MRNILLLTLFCYVTVRSQVDSIPYYANHTDDITCISFSPDGKYIVTGSWDQSIIIHRNDSTAETVQVVEGYNGAIRSIAFSRDGRTMIAGGQDGNLNFYIFDDSYFDVATLDTTLVINNTQINKLIYGPGMRTVFSAGDDGKFLTYDLVKEKVIPLNGKRPISAAAVAIDRMSYFIATEGNSSIHQFNVMGKEINTFEGHSNDITDLLVTVDRKYLISSSKDKTVRVWNIANAKEENKFEDHTWAVTDIDIDAFGTYLVSGGLDGKINIYELKTRTKLLSKELGDYKINALALSPDNTTVAAAAQPEGVSDPAGFFTFNTDLKARKIVLPKSFDISPFQKKYKEKELAKKNRLEEAKRVKEAKKAEAAIISEEQMLEKTEQVKITIKDNE